MADVDKFLCLDPESVRARITEKTRAVLFVGLGGRTGELEKIRSLCDEYGLALILDAAHMAGTKLNGISPARYADVTCYSFQAVKNLPTSDSGMVCFQDSGHDAFARQLSWLGINKDTQARTNSGTYSWDYEVMEFGFKYNGNSVAAALGIVGLRHLDEDNTYRRWLAGLYDGYLSEIGQVSVVPSPANCVNSSHIYQILVHNRDAVIEKLHTHNIYPGVHYRDNTNYWMYKDQAKWVPNARRVSDLLISLPLHLNMGEPEVARIAQVLRQVV